MAEVKEMNATVNNENTEAKEQENTNPASEATTEEKKDGIFKKIGNGFKKHGKKVLVPVGIAAAFAAGIAADKIGLPSFGKKTDAEQTEDQQ